MFFQHSLTQLDVHQIGLPHGPVIGIFRELVTHCKLTLLAKDTRITRHVIHLTIFTDIH
jgi:hypothetical protein